MIEIDEGKRLGEVVESSSTAFTAQSYVLHEAPSLGSLVRAGNGDLTSYAIVQQAATTSFDSGRRPIARGAQFADERAVYDENPQLEKLLRTDFDALVVGFRAGHEHCHYLPPRPVKVHAFVYQCTPAEIMAFTSRWDFLAVVAASAGAVATDELLAACVREAAAARDGDRRAFLVEAGCQIARLVGPDTNRLTSILKRIRPVGVGVGLG